MKRNLLYRGSILDLVKLDERWEVVEHVPAVCVLALQDGQVLGVKQSRPAIGQTTWEVPAGLIDEGETPEEAAARELGEETGFGGTLTLLTQAYTSPGFSTEKVYLFEATDLRPVDTEPDPDEPLQVVWCDPQTLWEAVRRGETASSFPSVLALHFALHR